MAKTVNFDSDRHPSDPERDINGYYDVTVNQPYGNDDNRFSTQTRIKLQHKLQPAPGSNDIKVGVSLTESVQKNIDIPDVGFTTLVRVAFVSCVGDVLQALLVPTDRDELVRISANYIDTLLLTIPNSEQDYINLRPGGLFFVTIELAQPEVEQEELEDARDVVVNQDPPVNPELNNKEEGVDNDGDPLVITAEPDSPVVEPTVLEVKTPEQAVDESIVKE